MSVIYKWVDRILTGAIYGAIVLFLFCVGMIAFLLVRGPQMVEYQTPDGGTVMCAPSGSPRDWGGDDGS